MVRCTGITLAGKQCKKFCKDTLCWLHTPPDTCGICLDDVCNYIKLDCGHKYCEVCINEWVCKSNICSCPTCRQEISKKIKSDAFDWGLTNFILIKARHYYLNLSVLSIEDQIEFMVKTEITKYSTLNDKEANSIRDIINNDTNLKLMWDTMWETIKCVSIILSNESRKSPTQSVLIYTFI